ncbi:MAG: T9SS type A sorting domain-containing protein [Bacteroidia bacterium]|nr:T9SS type A sorting domain-containing protein [Bacteroidia bacterium]
MSTFTYTDLAPPSGTLYYRIAAIKPDTCYPTSSLKNGDEPYSQSVSNLEDNIIGGINDVSLYPAAFSVYPNPFKEVTSIEYTIGSKADVQLSVYNILGEKIAEIVNETQLPDTYKYSFNATKSGYKAGMYYLKLNVNGNTFMQKLIETK